MIARASDILAGAVTATLADEMLVNFAPSTVKAIERTVVAELAKILIALSITRSSVKSVAPERVIVSPALAAVIAEAMLL